MFSASRRSCQIQADFKKGIRSTPMSITIIKPGISTTLQHFGHWGEQQFGVSIGGVMDDFSAKIANIICNKKENAPIVEMTLQGTEILFNKDAFIAITGSGAMATINNIDVPFYKLLHVPAFAILKMKPRAEGCRSYLAIAGEYKNQELGTPFKTGDLIELDETPIYFNGINLDENKIGISQWRIHLNENELLDKSIDCIEGPEFGWFENKAQEEFFSTTFTLSNQSNRMGYRLNEKISGLKEKKELISTAVTKGIVQITHDGNPIILMSDAQTTGGYPRIARIAPADITKLAQCRPGDKIRFNKVDKEASLLKSEDQLNTLKKIMSTIKMMH